MGVVAALALLWGAAAAGAEGGGDGGGDGRAADGNGALLL